MSEKLMRQALFEFYSELGRIQLTGDAVSISSPSPSTAASAQDEAILLINIYQPRVKTEEFFSVLKQVAEVVKKHHPDLIEEIVRIEEALPAGPDARDLFVSRVFVPGINLLNYLEKEVPPDTFGFLLNHAVKPFMQLYREKVSSFYDPEQWLRGRCPVCGSNPNMALLEKESGKRILSCGLCEARWRFQRLGCPYCNSGESEFFTVEGMEKYRVYTCKNCNGYIKTVDEKQTGGEVNLFWEDIESVQLDIVALHEGYCNRQSLPAAEGTEK